MFNNAFYNNLIKPKITPKPVVFKAVWMVLYIFMAISFVMILISRGERKNYAILAFLTQIILNILWPYLFFAAQKIKTAFFLLLFLIMTVVWMMVEFFKISKISAILQIPYLFWVIFASFLNYFFIKLNNKKN